MMKNVVLSHAWSTVRSTQDTNKFPSLDNMKCIQVNGTLE